MIQCIRSSSWTGYVFIEVRHDQPEVGFVKVPRDDKGSVRMFINVATEHIVKLGQSQALCVTKHTTVSACGGM